MQDERGTDVNQALAEARRVGDATKAAGQWFPTYLLLMGVVAFVWIIVIEALFPDGAARAFASAAVALGMGLVGWWGDSHGAYPVGAMRRVWIATAVWFGGYLFVVGPLVRWQAGDSPLWWTLASAVLAAPFLVVAWRERRRS